MKNYYAKSENSRGEKETVPHHLARTGELCRRFLAPIGYGGWGEQMGRLHDFGKWGELFQEVLRGTRTHVNHALPGAAVLSKRTEMAAVVASHHGDLQSYGAYRAKIEETKRGDGDRTDGQNRTISIYGREEFEQALSRWKSVFKAATLEKAPEYLREDRALSKMLFERFLFSALIDADWCGSAEHDDPDYLEKNTAGPLNAGEAMERLLALRREKRRNSGAAIELNSLRDALFDWCIEAGREEPGLFTLTAPTGLGKTLGLMAFALQHCISHGKRRVVLVLPYLSILGQNSGEYRKVIPNLLEIHGDVNWTKDMAALMERQDAPCIVTTNVSFFEPLFSARAGRCRHLHNLANSVIVLDEAQTLPGPLLDATLRTVKELCGRYGCTVVLSTATQPSFQYRPGLSWQPREIVPQPQALFEKTRRAKWQWRTERETPLDEIAEEMRGITQCCVILNLKKHVRRVLEALEGEAGVLCLTTDLCPAHRKRVLEEVHRRLSAGLPCRLVATQCVEAGVDLDFPVLFRALAPLDSLIQAAGRCNRNGSGCDGRFIVFVSEGLTGDPNGGYPTPAYGAAAAHVLALLKRHEIDPCNLQHIAEYYELLYTYAEGDQRRLRQAIADEDFQAVQEQYRIIPPGTVQVIVPYSGERELFDELRRELDERGLSRLLLRKAKAITVSTYARGDAERLCQRLYFRAPDGTRTPTEFYILHDPQFYDERAGLNLAQPFNGIV